MKKLNCNTSKLLIFGVTLIFLASTEQAMAAISSVNLDATPVQKSVSLQSLINVDTSKSPANSYTPIAFSRTCAMQGGGTVRAIFDGMPDGMTVDTVANHYSVIAGASQVRISGSLTANEINAAQIQLTNTSGAAATLVCQ